MKLSNFLTLKAILSTVSGIAFVLVPVPLLSIYGVALDASGVFVAQVLGASLIGIGLICWFSRNASSQPLAGILLALFLADGVGTVVLLMEQFSGRGNGLGWTGILTYLLLTLGLGYFRFRQPDVALQA